MKKLITFVWDCTCVVVAFWVALFQLLFFVAAFGAAAYLVTVVVVGIYLAYGWEITAAMLVAGCVSVWLMTYSPPKEERGEFLPEESFFKKDFPRKEFTLWMSEDCGGSYKLLYKATTPEELDPLADRLDEEGLRWFIEGPEGEPDPRVCKIHAGILHGMMA